MATPAGQTRQWWLWPVRQTRPWCFFSASSVLPPHPCLDFSSSHRDGQSNGGEKRESRKSGAGSQEEEKNISEEPNRPTLLRATMNGHFFSLRRLMDSSVCGSRPCMMSTTRMAMSHSELPRFLRLLQEPTEVKVPHFSSSQIKLQNDKVGRASSTIPTSWEALLSVGVCLRLHLQAELSQTEAIVWFSREVGLLTLSWSKCSWEIWKTDGRTSQFPENVGDILFLLFIKAIKRFYWLLLLFVFLLRCIM